MLAGIVNTARTAVTATKFAVTSPAAIKTTHKVVSAAKVIVATDAVYHGMKTISTEVNKVTDRTRRKVVEIKAEADEALAQEVQEA